MDDLLPQLRGRVVYHILVKDGFEDCTRMDSSNRDVLRAPMWYEPEYMEAFNRATAEVADMGEEELRTYAMLIEVGS